MSEAIVVEGLSKRFLIQRNRPLTLRDSIVRRLQGRHDPGREIWALKDLSFKLIRGQTLGVIGHNGAGKSTLLRLLCGIGAPTSGKISRNGTVSGLFELGSGFHPMMTGRENIRTAAILSGLTKRKVDSLEPEMIEFAELEDYIDLPVRTYSSGMYLRLAFASAIHLNPDVLLIDEVLAVGDKSFREKCLLRLDRFRQAGKTLMISSHDMDQVKKVCNDVLVLEEGRLVFQSDPESAVQHYLDLIRKRTEKRMSHHDGTEAALPEPELGQRWGTQEASVSAVRFFNEEGRAIRSVPGGEEIVVELDVTLEKKLSDFLLTLAFFTEKDVKCFETIIPSVRDFYGFFSRGMARFQCRIPSLPLLPGKYYVNVGIYPTNWEFVYDYHWQMHLFEVAGQTPNLSGIVSVAPVWSAQSVHSTNVDSVI